MLAITVGTGLTQPTGTYVKVPDPDVDSLARILSELPSVTEQWWSGHLWKDNLRRANLWLATCVLVADIDYEADCEPYPEHRDALVEMANSGTLPGSLFHLTPHGARVAFVLDRPYSEKRDVLSAAEAVNSILTDAIAGTGYKLDGGCTRDLARLFFTPNAKAKGIVRRASVIVMRREQYTASHLIADATPTVAPPPTPKPQKLSLMRGQSFEQAAERWVSDHPRQYPIKPETCPICSHNGCFHALPADTNRWFCFSTNHADGVGLPHRDTGGHHGDALDLEAFERGCKPVDILRGDGYLSSPAPRATRQVTSNAEPSPVIEETPTPDGAFRPWRSRSYLTAVSIIEANARDVLDGRKLEANEMTGDVELGRASITDADAHRVRANIEARFVGGVDKNNNEIGLQVSTADIFAAIAQVAHARPYHPVREYLTGLKWDGVERVAHVAADLLGADDSEINRAIVKRFFISAVARPLKPGCKVDTVPILVGKQGALKSSFFRILAGRFFVDTVIDISSDATRAYMTMRKAWILEWAELESLFRARDSSSVKAFLSSPSDTYIPKYGRYSVEVKRQGIIVGTINPEEFLTDETGHRRFWPLRVGEINIAHVAEQRDQLWAESVAMFQRGEQWWLTDREEELLRPAHDIHRTRDVWEGPIFEWLNRQGQIESTTTQEILTNALNVPKGQWTDRDMKRVARALRDSGEWKPDPNKAKGKPRSWIRTGGNNRGEKP